jgi:tetratricopeptide (TPR) repeat protein
MSTDYLEQVRREIAYIKPHENDDLEWYNEGMTLLRNGQLEAAELKFKELIMSQPEHHDGYHGLARVYQKLGRKDKALFFLQKAISKAKGFLSEGTLDQEVIDWLEQELKELHE